jgi:microcystin-dependent protein
MADPFLAEIRLMSFGYPPRGWAPCNGQVLPINQNEALYALLGTEFGGDGTTTFASGHARAHADPRRQRPPSRGEIGLVGASVPVRDGDLDAAVFGAACPGGVGGDRV